MTIEYTTGDILNPTDKYIAHALVNPVNCVGVMGKGLAKQFKEYYPKYFKAYAKLCKANKIKVGKMEVYELQPRLQHDICGSSDNIIDSFPHYIISFPTKQHWRNSSNLEDIKAGLYHLAYTITAYGIKSISIPKLGCGLGNLNWPDVRKLIVDVLQELDVKIIVYGKP